MVQVSPLASWAAVGGHGYRAASAVGLFPLASVAGHVAAAGAGPQGGPTVPSTTSNVVEIVPVAVVVTSLDNDGALQLTGMAELTTPPTCTLGWPESLLHSRMLPIEVWLKPLPVIVMLCPLVRPVAGVMVMVPVRPVAADADAVPATMVSPAMASTVPATTPSLDSTRRGPPDRDPLRFPRISTACLDTSHPHETRRASLNPYASRIFEHRSEDIITIEEPVGDTSTSSRHRRSFHLDTDDRVHRIPQPSGVGRIGRRT